MSSIFSLQSLYMETVPEDSPGGRLILQVSATDADIRSNAQISYELHGPGSERFSIDSETGTYSLFVKQKVCRFNCVCPVMPTASLLKMTHMLVRYVSSMVAGLSWFLAGLCCFKVALASPKLPAWDHLRTSTYHHRSTAGLICIPNIVETGVNIIFSFSDGYFQGIALHRICSSKKTHNLRPLFTASQTTICHMHRTEKLFSVCLRLQSNTQYF